MVARAPEMSSSGALAPSVAGMNFSLLVFQRPPLGFGINGLGQIGMPRHQQAEIDEVEHQEPRQPRGGDIGRTQTVAEQRHLAEESALAEPYLLAGKVDLDLAVG